MTAATMFASLIAFSAQAGGPKVAYTQPGIDMRTHEAQQAPIHWVSIEQIKESIKDLPPMAVSFDIDDTVAATSGCFHYGKQKYSPDDFSYLKNQDFWDEINAGCDKYSLPKQVAINLIKMHQERGDQVYLITGRTAGKNEQVTTIMQKYLGIKNMQPVNFMGESTFNKI
ncbi:Class B acid phosphatase [Mannheimia haemolytica]